MHCMRETSEQSRKKCEIPPTLDLYKMYVNSQIDMRENGELLQWIMSALAMSPLVGGAFQAIVASNGWTNALKDFLLTLLQNISGLGFPMINQKHDC